MKCFQGLKYFVKQTLKTEHCLKPGFECQRYFIAWLAAAFHPNAF